MKATEANLLKFLKKSPQFVIPIYQRSYSWLPEQCRQLWSDLLRAGRNDDVAAHFIGSIVYVERSLSTVTSQEALLVIDGQQRLTTSSLLIAALANHIEKTGLSEPLEGFSARKLRNYYLLNPDEEGERHFKLLLADTDRDTLLSILQAAPAPAEPSVRVVENFELFVRLIQDHQHELVAVCKGIAKLTIVDVSLDRNQDNPQLIFESMNSTGRELSQADLIRNFILMGLEPRLQTELYKNFWRPMEKGFGQAAYAQHFDAFMRHYLTAKTGEIPNVREVYTAFKQYAREKSADTRDLVSDIYAFSIYYCAMALGDETEADLKHAFHDLRELKVDVAYPFLLDAYHQYRQRRLSTEEMLGVARLVESYVFRRAICAIPTNSLNKTFAGLSRTLNKNRYLESAQAALLLLPSYRRFPLDDEFEREIKRRDLYNFRSRSFWLRRLENFGRKERVLTDEYTIEHILPQNESLSAAWQAELGENWKDVQAQFLHTLGNLTLTGYNSEYSDHPFSFKRDAVTDKTGNPIGLAHSPLKLNRGMSQVKVWNEAAIVARADRLAAEATQIWRAPDIGADVLAAYRPSKKGAQYTIEDHPNLMSGAMAALFQELRQRILAIDPCVTEEFLKLYVAYKAETNFVDIVPQAKRLRLSLNLRFHDIDDPKGLCVDVSDRGRWGNGDVELGLASADELPYVMGLIRQSFDHQMSSLSGD
jgi:uncharacterized protein with ParB-like and HNH nuclease domain/predicted transport protein